MLPSHGKDVMSEPKPLEDPCIEFSHTVVDQRAGHRACLSFILESDGIAICYEFGSTQNQSSTYVQRLTNLATLKALLEACRHPDGDYIPLMVNLADYDEDDREMSIATEEFLVSIDGTINFLPFLIKFLPLMIRAAEMLEDEPTLTVSTGTKPALC